jgi:hypothetical protein
MKNEKFLVEKVRSDVLDAVENGRTYTVTLACAIEALEAFIAGTISREDLTNWADFFDVNENVELESEEILPDVMFELSSPEINGLIDEERAGKLAEKLRMLRSASCMYQSDNV